MTDIILTLGLGENLELVLGGSEHLDLVIGGNGEGPVIPAYTGEYEVTPALDGQTLLTNGKRMLDDVTVHEIPVTYTSNEYGGKTVVIG